MKIDRFLVGERILLEIKELCKQKGSKESLSEMKREIRREASSSNRRKEEELVSLVTGMKQKKGRYGLDAKKIRERGNKWSLLKLIEKK